MSDPTQYACTLTTVELPDRIEQLDTLNENLLSRERNGQQVRLRFAASAASTVEAFVRDESRCCSFYEFNLERTTDAVELWVVAPSEAEELLTSLYEAFGDGS